MDDNNKKVMETWKNKGQAAAVEQMFQHPTDKDDNGKPKALSYAEMRDLYG